jgi:hypothetical protein
MPRHDSESVTSDDSNDSAESDNSNLVPEYSSSESDEPVAKKPKPSHRHERKHRKEHKHRSGKHKHRDLEHTEYSKYKDYQNSDYRDHNKSSDVREKHRHSDKRDRHRTRDDMRERHRDSDSIHGNIESRIKKEPIDADTSHSKGHHVSDESSERRGRLV